MSHDDSTPVKAARPVSDWSVKSEVVTLIVAGLVFAFIGALIAYAAWPATEATSAFSSDLEETGSTFGALIGCALAAVGQLMTTSGVIAVGVRLGTRD